MKWLKGAGAILLLIAVGLAYQLGTVYAIPWLGAWFLTVLLVGWGLFMWGIWDNRR